MEESLHNKLDLYIPNKKITNYNFITSLKNKIENYQTLKENILRHDYVTKALIYYSKTTKKNEYTRIDYQSFKSIEHKIIMDENANIDIDNINNIIKSVNKLELDEIKDNNINNFNENEDELSDNSLKGEENNLKIINSDIENSDEYSNDFSKSYIEDSKQSNPDEMIDDI